jgi:hypothetical protein
MDDRIFVPDLLLVKLKNVVCNVSVCASEPRSFARVLHSMAAEVPSRQDL